MSSTTALIHTGFRQIGMTDDADRRALYVRVTGIDRLTQMDESNRDAVLVELGRLGFKPARRLGGSTRRLSGRYAGKLQALWIAAFNLALVRNRDDLALEAFVRRQTGLERERFLHRAADAALVIEALKGWMAREAGVDWRFRGRADGERIARAQWHLLHPGDAAGLMTFATDLSGTEALNDRQWIRVMNLLGGQLRQLRAKTP